MNTYVIIADIDCKPGFPDEAVYCALNVSKHIPLESIFIVKVLSPDDCITLQNTINALFPEETTLLCTFSDFTYQDTVIKKIFDIADAHRKKNGLTIATGTHATTAVDIFFKNSPFMRIIEGWSWTVDPSVITHKCDVSSPLKGSRFSGYPPMNRFKNVIPRIVNLSRCYMTDDEGIYFGYKTSLMCNNACFFCVSCKYKQFGGYSPKSAEQIVTELGEISKALGTKRITLFSFNYTMEDVCFIIEKGYTFGHYCGKMCVRDLELSVFDIMQSGGSRCMFAGVETLEPDVLKKMKKRFDFKHMYAMFDYAGSLGMMVEANLIFGLKSIVSGPLNVSDIVAQLPAAGSFSRNYSNVRINALPYMPFIGTPLGDKLWRNSPHRDSISAENYMLLAAKIINGLPLPKSLPLPPCYADRDAYAVSRLIYHDFLALNQFKTSLHFLKVADPHKARFCQALLDHCHDQLEQGRYGFGPFLKQAHEDIAHWK